VDLKFFSLLVGIILVSGLISAPMAYAIPASGDMSKPTTPDPSNPISTDGGSEDTYTIDRIIKYDPDAGPWVKELSVNEGTTTYFMMETITVAADSPPIEDWHEVIMTPDTTWLTSCPVIGGPSFSPMITTPAGPVGPSMMDATGIWFDFPPVLPGESFTVKKCYDTSAANTVFIYEWPTIKENGRMAVGGEFIPIDATAVLIAGVQSNALTVLSAFVVIGAISFGVLVISVKRKRN